MDIAGAKALKERLGHNDKDAGPAPSADVPEDAPPIYHYVGVSEAPPEAPATDPADKLHGRPRSLLRRLGLTLR
jgi:hypothetical protein